MDKPDQPRSDHPVPGTADYEEHLRGEIEHYGRIFKEGMGRETLVQPVPASWDEMERRAASLIRSMTGQDMVDHVVSRLRRQPGVRMLSIGSGPGGVEISCAGKAPQSQILCLDINPELLELGQQRAHELGLAVQFEKADFNTIELPANDFDLVFCHASLHHVIELERLAEQINKCLRPGGVLITVDIVTCNGYLMWPETREVAQALWKTLPVKYRLNHTAHGVLRVDEEIWEADMSTDRMECARSEDILPVLGQAFVTNAFVPYFSLCRRFFDTMYGPNYDLSRPLDLSIVNWIWELDRFYLNTGRLRPETFFGIYRAQ